VERDENAHQSNKFWEELLTLTFLEVFQRKYAVRPERIINE
jgi:hypothetical protein